MTNDTPGGGPTPTRRPASHPQPTIVPAVAYAPDRRRTRWLAILEVCPACGRAHQFYGSTAGPPRHRSCGGRRYALHPLFGGNSDQAAVSA